MISFWKVTCLPALKLTWHLKITPWKRRFLLETNLFRCYVSFRECALKSWWLVQMIHFLLNKFKSFLNQWSFLAPLIYCLLGVICYLPPIKGTRKLHWLNPSPIIHHPPKFSKSRSELEWSTVEASATRVSFFRYVANLNTSWFKPWPFEK